MLERRPVAIDFAQEGGTLQMHPLGALLSSHDQNWGDVYLQYYHYPPDEFSRVAFKQHLIVIHTEVSPSVHIEQRTDGHLETGQLGIGDIIIIPADVPYNARWDLEHGFILLGLEPKTFAYHALRKIEKDSIELTPHFAKADPLIHGIGLALKTEIESNGLGGRLYRDALTSTLLSHLLRHYSAQKPEIQALKGGLSRSKLKQVIDYMTDHLSEDLPMQAIAEQAGMSQSHFFSVFRQSTGLSPHQYRLRQRIERAQELLLHSELSIAEISISVGFYDQSHLARHMRRLLGVTPKQVRQRV
ncbi:MAG: helix-turn-helix domain-containing protein [Leptolyngbya sp. SIO1E4]|nr:helix-turn-helix domain-containing protein [Leptolyngbya sp. SIO1E4]